MIESNKPVGVFSGNRGINLNLDAFNPRGKISEQLPPVEKWGTEFFVMGLPDRNNTLIKYVAAYENTTVTVEAGPPGPQVWRAEFDGDYRETIVVPGRGDITITADGPILVVQF